MSSVPFCPHVDQALTYDLGLAGLMKTGPVSAAEGTLAKTPVEAADQFQHLVDASLADDSILPEELAEKLLARGVTGDLLKHWAELEHQELKALQRQQGEPVSQELRSVALKTAGVLVKIGAHSPSDWFDSAVLIDKLLSKDASVDKLPVKCAAAVAIQKKFFGNRGEVPGASGASAMVVGSSTSCSSTGPSRTAAFAKIANSTAQYLATLGHPDAAKSEITPQAIDEQERALLKMLKWQIHRPSVVAWLGLLCGRLDVLSENRWSSALDWIANSKTMQDIAGTLVLQHASYGPETCPRRVASGLFCLFLVSSRLLPMDVLRPDNVEPAAWQEMFASQCGGLPPPCQLSPARVASMLEVMPLVTGRRLTSLKDDLHHVLVAMQKVAQSTFATSPTQTPKSCVSPGNGGAGGGVVGSVVGGGGSAVGVGGRGGGGGGAFGGAGSCSSCSHSGRGVERASTGRGAISRAQI